MSEDWKDRAEAAEANAQYWGELHTRAADSSKSIPAAPRMRRPRSLKPRPISAYYRLISLKGRSAGGRAGTPPTRQRLSLLMQRQTLNRGLLRRRRRGASLPRCAKR